MPRGDEERNELKFSDRDDDMEDLGYSGGGGASYDEDEDDEGSWGITSDRSDELWDKPVDEDDEEGGEDDGFGGAAGDVEDEEEADAFGSAGRRGRSSGGSRGGAVKTRSSAAAGKQNAVQKTANATSVVLTSIYIPPPYCGAGS